MVPPGRNEPGVNWAPTGIPRASAILSRLLQYVLAEVDTTSKMDPTPEKAAATSRTFSVNSKAKQLRAFFVR